jgi:hypothetical protein
MSFFLSLLIGCPNPGLPKSDPDNSSHPDQPGSNSDQPTSKQQAALESAKSTESPVLQDGCTFITIDGTMNPEWNRQMTEGYNNDSDWAYCNQKLNAFRASVTSELSPTHDVHCERSTVMAMDGDSISLIETCTAETKPEPAKE